MVRGFRERNLTKCRIIKKKTGMKKKQMDPFLKKVWYDIKVCFFFFELLFMHVRASVYRLWSLIFERYCMTHKINN